MTHDELTPQALQKRYNPEGSLLRRHQLRMLDILIELDRICNKHHITYWLSSGTLLGAIRHQGFIPWDDDLDVELPYSEYKKLMKILPAELPSWLALQNHEQDSNYLYCYAKLRDKNSLLDEGLPYDCRCKEKGIYIDIFPMEKHPIWLHRLSELTFGHLYKILRLSPNDNHAFRSALRLYKLNTKFIYPCLRLFTTCFYWGSNRTFGMGIPLRSKRNFKHVYPLKKAIFEGHEFPVPHDSDAMLRGIYGDYMKLPDLNKLQLHVVSLQM